MSIKNLFPTESSWAIGQGENEGLPLLLRSNSSAAPLIGHPEFGLRVGIAVPFNEPTENGLPSPEESEQLFAIEDLLTSHLEANQQAILVLVITTGNMREFIFYAGDKETIDSSLTKACSNIPSHEIQCYIESDPQWDLYQEYKL